MWSHRCVDITVVCVFAFPFIMSRSRTRCTQYDFHVTMRFEKSKAYLLKKRGRVLIDDDRELLIDQLFKMHHHVVCAAKIYTRVYGIHSYIY